MKAEYLKKYMRIKLISGLAVLFYWLLGVVFGAVACFG